MTQVNCLCAQICLPLICGGNGGFDGINGDVFCERCDGGGGGGGGGVVGGGRAGSIGLNKCIAFTGCINCLFFAFVQYWSVGGDFIEGGLGLE